MTNHSEILRRYAIEPKKSLGQNFLTQDALLEKIANHVDLAGKHVIEVGPGYGALTEQLISASPASLTLVEYDPRMVAILQDRRKRGELAFAGEFDIEALDVLQFSPSRPSVLVANIPYYITSPILFRFLYEVSQVPDEMIILMQKEVADKITKQKGYQNSYLSLALEYGCDTMEKLFEVKAENFVPPPKVDSAVVHFRARSEAPDPEAAKAFLSLISRAFSQPRKKAVSNLANAGIATKEALEAIFSEMGIRTDARAETISLDDWKRLIQRLGR
jgi:16S rRNA (adenine1518-N6/adenine1519-N6)-dimethyltransferase